MPDLRRLREEIKPSETDEGDGKYPLLMYLALLTEV
jgi:hypothetical protein